MLDSHAALPIDEVADSKASGKGLAHVRRFVHLARENLHYVQPAITGLLHREGVLSWQPFVLGLRHNGADLAVEDIVELKERPREIVLFVHGLMGDDVQWAQAGQSQVHLGKAWASQYDILPLYVRYNTGDHISFNGRRLANLLEHLALYHKGNIRRIRLVGHSLGGLVAHRTYKLRFPAGEAGYGEVG